MLKTALSMTLNVMTPNIADGFKAIFTDAYTLCLENDEAEPRTERTETH